MNNIEKIELLEHIAIAYKDDETINNELVSPQGKFIKNKELAEAVEHLIQENKELKEEIKSLNKMIKYANDMLAEEIENRDRWE